MLHQTMSGAAAQKKIDNETQHYARIIRSGEWPLETAIEKLRKNNEHLGLFQMAGLAKAIACFLLSA